MSADPFGWAGLAHAALAPAEPDSETARTPPPCESMWRRLVIVGAVATHLSAALLLVAGGPFREWALASGVGCLALSAGASWLVAIPKAPVWAPVVAGGAAVLAGLVGGAPDAASRWQVPLVLWWLGVLAARAGHASADLRPDNEVANHDGRTRRWRGPAPAVLVTAMAGTGLLAKPGVDSVPLLVAYAACATAAYLGAARVGAAQRRVGRERQHCESADAQARSRQERIHRRQWWDALLHDKVLGALRLGAQDDPTSRAGARSLAGDAIRAMSSVQSQATASTPATRRDDPRTRILQAARDVGIRADVDLLVEEIDPAIADAVLEAVAEAIRNAARHARVGEVSVLGELGPAVRVAVHDAGVGFDPAQVDPARLGVKRSILARLESIGGEATLETSPGAGTTVRISVARSALDAPAPSGDATQSRSPGTPQLIAVGLLIAALAVAGWFQPRTPSGTIGAPGETRSLVGAALTVLAVEAVSAAVLLGMMRGLVVDLARFGDITESAALAAYARGARLADQDRGDALRHRVPVTEVLPTLRLLASSRPLEDADRDRCRALEHTARDSLAAAALVDPGLSRQLRQARELGAVVSLATAGYEGDPVELVAVKVALRAALPLVTPTSRVTARWTPTRRPEFATVVVTDPAAGSSEQVVRAGLTTLTRAGARVILDEDLVMITLRRLSGSLPTSAAAPLGWEQPSL